MTSPSSSLDSGSRAGAVFLSYASQDAEVARRIAEALRAAGVEVWFDQNELVGGDAWDAKIRKQIKDCALFVPVISAATQARAEGYFRLEWKLAVDRSHLMADDQPFFFPVVIDAIPDATARVPDKFREVQWTRLRLDETPGELAARVARLLSAESAAGNSDRVSASRRPTAERGASSPSGRWRWGMVFAVVGGIIALMFAAPSLWRAIQRPEPQRSPATLPALSTAPVSEARQLAAKARAILNQYDSTADDYAVAEGYIKRALELDPNDGEIWAVSSVLNTAFGTRGFDQARARDAAARSQAERALKLAPDSPEALFALGRWQRENDPDLTLAEKTFLQVLARAPDHSGALNSLGSVYARQGRVDEAVTMYRRSAHDMGSTALAGYTEFVLFFRRARFAEAERAVLASIAAQPSANSQAGLAMLLLTWKGDAEGAAKAVSSGPASTRNEHRTIWITAQVHLARRAPEDALRVLERMSDDYIIDNWFDAPTAYLAGRAHAQAGRPEAARVAWEAGLGVVEARLKREPASRTLHLARGELLAWLGREEEALHEARTVNELARQATQWWFFSPLRIHAALGRVDDALPLLQEQLQFTREQRDRDIGWPLTPALLRLDPLWDKLRGDVRFQKLITEAEAAEVANRPPRDWPKDAELKRVIALVDSLDATLEDFRLADEIATRALAAAPTDPEMVTVAARVHSAFLVRNFDFRPERTALAKKYGERAVQLAPDEPEALYALSIFLLDRAGDAARAETLARRTCELDPDLPRFWRQLQRTVIAQRPDEGLALADKNAARFPRDVLARYELSIAYRNRRQWVEFERETDATLALAPLANAINWKARASLLRSDLAEMRQWLERVPARARAEERTVLSCVLYGMLSGDYDYGLKALQGFAEPWFNDASNYSGPAALPRAMLLAQQGKTGLARAQYEVALAELARQRAANPADLSGRAAESWVMLGLGRVDEARALNRTAFETIRRPFRVFALSGWGFDLIPRTLLLGERDAAVELIREAAAEPEGRRTIRGRMQWDARMAPFRDDPEIQALLKEPEAKK